MRCEERRWKRGVSVSAFLGASLRWEPDLIVHRRQRTTVSQSSSSSPRRFVVAEADGREVPGGGGKRGALVVLGLNGALTMTGVWEREDCAGKDARWELGPGEDCRACWRAAACGYS